MGWTLNAVWPVSLQEDRETHREQMPHDKERGIGQDAATSPAMSRIAGQRGKGEEARILSSRSMALIALMSDFRPPELREN